jgi:hypothetical protein
MGSDYISVGLQLLTDPLTVPPYDTWVRMKQGNDTDRGELNNSEKSQSLYHFCHDKLHVNYPGSELQPSEPEGSS